MANYQEDDEENGVDPMIPMRDIEVKNELSWTKKEQDAIETPDDTDEGGVAPMLPWPAKKEYFQPDRKYAAEPDDENDEVEPLIPNLE